MTMTDRYNTFTAETAQAFLDSAFLVQRQNAQFVQSWFGVVEANQQVSRDLVGRLVKNGQEARSLWYDLWQEGFRNTTDLFVKAADTATENVHKASQQVSNGTTKAKETVASK
jgi:hypothetical protein